MTHTYIIQFFRDDRNILITILVFIGIYFLSMDVVLYHTFQNTTFVEESKTVVPRLHSPFHPLTAKLITVDHFSHYMTKPSAELFNYVTDFSHVFYFITPNVISVSHVFVGLLAGKLVSSESLRDRRIGVCVYEIRSWLDSLDGAVHRSQMGVPVYKVHGEGIGSQVDNICDIIGGLAFCVGTMFYLIKHFSKPETDVLPTRTKGAVTGTLTCFSYPPTKEVIMIKIALFGTLVASAGRSWEMTVSKAETLFQFPLSNPQATATQTVLLHSAATWWTLWSWKWVGQTFLHYLAVAILLDKVWEYISYVLYIGFFALILLDVISFCYLNEVQSLLLNQAV